MSQGLISLFIPLIVIILAMVTKRIIASLVVGLLAGGILLLIAVFMVLQLVQLKRR